MILIDSSVWIDYFNRGGGLARAVDEFLETRETIAVAGIIEQEVLQGLRSESAAAEITTIFDAMFHLPPPDREIHHRAALTHRQLKRKGLTVRSGIDCLLAEMCIRHTIPLWHKDRDFGVIARLRPLLIFLPQDS